MTQNQIKYWELQEGKRHNLETESVARGTLAENTRHNVESESIEWFKGREQARHNVVAEKETERHNRADESVRWFTAQETQRHNEQDEDIRRTTNDIRSAELAETKRYNEVQETLKREGFANDKQVAVIRASGQAVSRLLPVFFNGNGSGDVTQDNPPSNPSGGGDIPGQTYFPWAPERSADPSTAKKLKDQAKREGLGMSSGQKHALGVGIGLLGAGFAGAYLGGGSTMFAGGGGKSVIHNENR